MDEAQLAALFQPFNRLGRERGGQEGTGIGLVVTRRLVEMMGGTLGVSSSPDVGSLFWVEFESAALPDLLPTTAPPRAAATSAPAVRATHLLLYVEDNPANLRLVQEIVRLRPELRLLPAPEARLGIELARAHHPDLILLDLNLPGMSGLEALKVLRADPETCAIPVLALTANAMPRDIERGLSAGFFRYLTKPIDIAAFNAAIDSTLAHVRALAEGGVR